ncbi:MAG TPA: hypothetical protein IAC20_01880 [Candidatus Faecisoma merdavium]|nr:hypothetical protein [Candidatus Faecisoma merdavium]
MEKKLPKVFANKIDKELNNNETVYYNKNEERKIEEKDPLTSVLTVNQKINQIFSSARYVYKADVIITTKNGKVNKRIIGRNRNELITMDNEVINVNDILDIEFQKNND